MSSVRRSKLLREAGPYRVESLASGILVVTPRWPQFRAYTEDDGGGPGVFSRLQVADDLERWLNSPYEIGGD